MYEATFVLCLNGICAALLVSFKLKLRAESAKEFVRRFNCFHPNWATAMGFVLAYISFILFYLNLRLPAATFYTVAAYFDGVDGTLARARNSEEELKKQATKSKSVVFNGAFLDALSDKLRYTFPLVYFASTGILNFAVVCVFIAIEITGQFLIRPMIFKINRMFFLNITIAANKIGKVKTVLTDALVMYCFLLEGGAVLPDCTIEFSIFVTVLALLSGVFKIVRTSLVTDPFVPSFAEVLYWIIISAGRTKLFFKPVLKPVLKPVYAYKVMTL